jgi:hypothetical protein
MHRSATLCLLCLVAVQAEPSFYPHYPDRATTDLAGSWDFVFAGHNVSLASFDVSKLNFNSTQTVPVSLELSRWINLTLCVKGRMGREVRHRLAVWCRKRDWSLQEAA